MTPARAGVAAAALAALLPAACGKSEAPRADAATERAQARERARNDVFGTQMKSLDKANALGADMNKKAQDSVDNAEKNAR